VSWSYFIEAATNSSTKVSFKTPEIGVVEDRLSIEASMKHPDDCNIVKVELIDQLFFVSTGEIKKLNTEGEVVFSTEHTSFSGVFLLSALNNQTQIYTIRLKTEENDFIEIAQIVLFPLSHQPKVTLVLGSPRSGTTIVGQMVQIGFAVESHGESHVAQGFDLLCREANQYFNQSQAAKTKGTLCSEIPSLFVKSQLILAMRNLYQRIYRGADIVDKTPGNKMLQSLPLFFLAFPQAKVIYCRRRGIENIESRQRKFPKVSFKGHCEQWSRNIEIWKKVKLKISNKLKHDDWFIEIEQYELANFGEKCSKDMVKFLEVPGTRLQSIINYQADNVLQKTAVNHQLAKSIEDTDWSDQDKKTFREICSSVMSECNYSYDANYYNKAL
jgi:hypothetical protein